MARQILPIAGQIVGGMIGGPVGAAIGGAIGSVVGNAIDPQIIKGPKLGDGQVQTSAEGVFRPIVLGTGAVMGNIIHRGPEVVRKHRERQGKGSGPKVETERRYRTFAIRVAEGPIAGILRIWMDEKLVYDIRPESEIPAESDQFAEGFRLYLGDEDQLPDPDIEAYLGIGNVNAYRGTAYIVFPNFDLTDYGDRIPQFRFEVSSSAQISVGPYFATSTGQTNGSILRTYDFENWEPIDTGLSNYPTCIRCVNGKVIVGSFGEVAVSDNEGDTFRIVDLPPGHGNNPCASISWGSVSGYCVVFQGASTPVYFSEDSVNFITRSHTGTFVRAKRGSETLGAATVVALSGGKVGVTLNSGSSWSESDLDGINNTIGYVTNYNGTFLAVERQAGLIAYSNSPGSPVWQSINPGGGGILGVYGIDASESHVAFITGDGEIRYTESFPSGWVDGPVIPGNLEPSQWQSAFRFLGRKWYAINQGGDIYSGDTPGQISLVGSAPGQASFNGIAGFEGVEAVGGSMSLGDVVSFLHQRVGSTPLEFDVTPLSDDVDGVVFAGDYTAADCIRTLMPVYMFDASEHDAGGGYRINYVKRGGPVVATITADDLVDEPEESVREDALERPQKLHMHFQSPTVGYAPAKATSMRNSPDVLVTGEVSVSVPVVFGDVDEAWQRAGVMHQVAWSEVAGTQELVLSDAWLELVPTDNIGLVLRDQQRRFRITKIEQVEGTLKCEMMTDRQSSYTSNLTGVPLPEPTPPPPSIVGPTEFALLDIPALTDSGDRLLYYVGVSGQSPAWHGAVIQRSMDGGANYEDVLTVRQNTIMGTLVDPVTDASEHYTDTTNVVRVQLFTDDELQSLTQQQFLSEGGAFALEKPGGGWEVMQYRDADQNMDGEWELSTLLRGRLNSGTDEHLAGARFVLLDGVYAVDADVGMIGQDLTHRAVSLGTSPEVAPVSTDTYTGQSQIEWPVAHILSDGVDSGSLPVQIIPQHRFGTEDHPVRSINWQGYRLTATDGSNTATVDTLSDTHTFSVGGWSDPITVTASQLNRFTGAGPSVSEEFE